MENFICSVCFSSGAIRFECGHRQCHSCSSGLNETNIKCYRCSILPVSNEEFGVILIKKSCDNCCKNFDSNAQYEKHKKKKSCPLVEYGCTEQINDCSMDKHLIDEKHIRAMKLCINLMLSSPINLHFSKLLTKFCSQINNCRIETGENDELKSINDILVSDFGAKSTIQQIEYCDNYQLDEQKKQDLLNRQLIDNEQMTNSIKSRINQLEEQTIQNQFQVCDLCSVEYNISLTHVCQRLTHELQEQINKLSLENKQEKQINEDLNHLNEYLTINRNLLETTLSNTPVSRNGLLIWLIENISQKIDQSYAHSEYSRPLHSPTFLSLTGDHPLNVQLYLYGDSLLHRKYISIHVTLSPNGNNTLSIPLICCLVDQTNDHHHIIRQTNVNLNQNTIGIICCFSKFVETTEVHKENSRFIENDTLCLIVKLHENELNQYKHHSLSIRNALQEINSLTHK